MTMLQKVRLAIAKVVCPIRAPEVHEINLLNKLRVIDNAYNPARSALEESSREAIRITEVKYQTIV